MEKLQDFYVPRRLPSVFRKPRCILRLEQCRVFPIPPHGKTASQAQTYRARPPRKLFQRVLLRAHPRQAPWFCRVSPGVVLPPTISLFSTPSRSHSLLPGKFGQMMAPIQPLLFSRDGDEDKGSRKMQLAQYTRAFQADGNSAGIVIGSRAVPWVSSLLLLRES